MAAHIILLFQQQLSQAAQDYEEDYDEYDEYDEEEGEENTTSTTTTNNNNFWEGPFVVYWIEGGKDRNNLSILRSLSANLSY